MVKKKREPIKIPVEVRKAKEKEVNHITLDYGDKVYSAILNKYRRVFMYGNISTTSAEELNKKLIAMSIDSPEKPITIEINSGGGSCIAGLSIIDTIESLSCPVYTIITGVSASMATFISIAGDRRFITKNAYWMAHPISLMKADYIGFLKDSMPWLKGLEKRCLSMYLKKTNLPKETIEKCKRGEVWLNAKQCIKYNVADEILKKQVIVRR